MSDADRETRSPLWSLPVEQEVREELEFHLEMRVRQYMAEGVDEEEARQRALAGFGNTDELSATCRRLARTRNRRYRRRDAMGDWMLDLRYAFRQFRRNPGFTVLVMVILAFGLGATLTVFSMFDRLLLRPLEYPAPERLVTLWEEHATRGSRKNVVNPANFLLFRDESESMSPLAAFITIDSTLGGDQGTPMRAKARIVTVDFFDVLGVEAEQGRTFTPDDFVEGTTRTTILSHRLWRSRYGGREEIVGESILVNEQPALVVGVLPEGVALDMGAELRPYGDAPDLYMTLPEPPEWRTARGRWLMIVGRLSDGATLDDARAEVEILSSRMGEVRPDYNAQWKAKMVPLDTHLNDVARAPLTALAIAVALILLIVCVNVAGLLSARAASRSGEISIREALGAGRRRLVRQLLVESMVTSFVALGLGVGFSLLASPFLESLLPADLLSTSSVRDQAFVPMRTLALSGSLLLVCVLTFGIVPGVMATRRVSQTRGSTRPDVGHYRLRTWLVFAEVVLAVVLLVASGLTLRSFSRLLDVDPGFASSGVVSFGISPSREVEDPQIFDFYDTLLEHLDSQAGVELAGAVTHIPIASVGAATSYFPVDRPEPEPGTASSAAIRVIRGSYLQTMEIPLLEGRHFDSGDRPGIAVGAVIVNRQLAQRHWPDGSAIGKQLHVSWGEAGVRQIVGIAADVRHAGPAVEVKDTIYFPHSQERERAMTIVLRSDGENETTVLARALDTVAELHPTLPVYDARNMSAVIGESVQKERALALLIGIMASVALILAALGIYGMMAYAVVAREREFGLRMALGASPGSIGRLVLRQAAILMTAALSVGITISLLGGRYLESLLFEVSARDAGTYLIVSVILVLGCLFAALLPALQASRLAPMNVLRQI